MGAGENQAGEKISVPFLALPEEDRGQVVAPILAGNATAFAQLAFGEGEAIGLGHIIPGVPIYHLSGTQFVLNPLIFNLQDVFKFFFQVKRLEGGGQLFDDSFVLPPIVDGMNLISVGNAILVLVLVFFGVKLTEGVSR